MFIKQFSTDDNTFEATYNQFYKSQFNLKKKQQKVAKNGHRGVLPLKLFVDLVLFEKI